MWTMAGVPRSAACSDSDQKLKGSPAPVYNISPRVPGSWPWLLAAQYPSVVDTKEDEHSDVQLADHHWISHRARDFSFLDSRF